MKILLHACCGPCSLEPVRLLREAGHELAVYYANANIHPEAEYARRLDTLRAWAHDEGIPVIEGTYDVAAWEAAAGRFGASMDTREERCRACYRLRLEETARYAAAHGYDAVSTTLTVTTRYPIFRKVWYACGYPGFSMSTVLFPPRSCVSRISRYSFPAPSTMSSGRQFTPLA